MVDAIVLAGSKNDGVFLDSPPADFEALIDIGGVPMVKHVVSALKNSGQINSITIVGPAKELSRIFNSEFIKVVANGDSLEDNILLGLNQYKGSDRILISGSDIPLLSPEAVNDFLYQCRESNYDFYYPIVPKQVVEADFIGVKRTYFKLLDGVYTGGNLFLLNPKIVEHCLHKARKFIALRKNPFALSRLVGFGFLLKFITCRLSLSEAETTLSKLFGIRGKAIISNYSSIGVDVDKPSDLELVRRVVCK